jgi:acyl carrier protein
MKDEIIAKTAIYLQSEILKQPIRTIDPDEPLLSSGLIDSFSLVDVALFIEDTFNVTIEDTDLNADAFDTLNQLADLVISRQD